jgi:hypothetical protein
MVHIGTDTRNGDDDFDEELTKDNVEAELARLKLIDDDYQSDDENRVKNPFELNKTALFLYF